MITRWLRGYLLHLIILPAFVKISQLSVSSYFTYLVSPYLHQLPEEDASVAPSLDNPSITL